MSILRSTLAQLCVLLTLPFWAGYVSAQAIDPPEVSVESFFWTDSVNRQTRQFQGKLGKAMRGKKIFLWMQLRGSAALLSRLQNSPNTSIPIRHEWYKYQSDAITAESPDALDLTVDLSIGKKDSMQKLALEVDATGQFRWRVWSGKKRVTPGWWRVDLVYATGEPVICPTPENELKPCKFMIEVKR